jgi:hypothetical protein
MAKVTKWRQIPFPYQKPDFIWSKTKDLEGNILQIPLWYYDKKYYDKCDVTTTYETFILGEKYPYF